MPRRSRRSRRWLAVAACALLPGLGAAATVTVTGTDTSTKTYSSPDGDILVQSWTASPTARITLSARTLVRFAAGTTVQAGATLSAGVTNRPPTIQSLSVSGPPDQVLALPLVANDPDGDALSWTLSAPTKGVLEGTAPALSYRPNAGATGSDSITVTVSDGYASAQALVSITLAAPSVVAVDDAYAYPSSGALVVGTANGLLANDTGAGVTAAVIASPAHGVLSAVGTNGTFTYTANAGYIGRDSFQYRATGPSGSATGWATIDVGSGLTGQQNALVPVRDGASFATNEAAYLAAVVPGRIWDTLAPGSGVPVLQAVGSRYIEVAAGGTATLSVKTVAGKPATFHCYGGGTFSNGKNTISVKADASGVAIATIAPNGQCPVVVGSLAASGVIRFILRASP